MFSFLLHRCQAKELLGHMVNLCLTLKETAKPVFKVAASFNIPISSFPTFTLTFVFVDF